MAHWRRRVAAALVAVCAWAWSDGTVKAAGDRERAVARVGDGSVAAGHAHTVVASPNGRVFSWGAGGRGQIGDGSRVDRWSPTPVPGLPDVVMVSAGRAHTLALTAAGDVFAWGANGSGRIGDGTHVDRLLPVRLTKLRNGMHIAAGGAHSLALTRDGRVFAWGRNMEGQLGNGSRTSSAEPVEITGLPTIVAIAAGATHSLAVALDGHVWAWGNNDGYRLGDGTTKDHLRPVEIGLANIAAVAAGRAHSLALSRTGEVYAWGHGGQGQLGLGTTKSRPRPTLVAGLRAASIDAGDNFSGAVLTNGKVAMWGANGSGQLGDQTVVRRLRPIMASGIDAIVSLGLGAAHSVALRENGEVRAWGEGESGRLGFGSELDATAPMTIAANVLGWGGTRDTDPPPPPPPPVPPSPPSITPPGGIFGAAQTVSLVSSTASAVIHYTVDGTSPTNTSPVYTQPVLVDTTATLKAVAISDAGLSSTPVSADFTIDVMPPTITATATPSSVDWLDQPVPVSFACGDNLRVASCTPPVTVEGDGVTEVRGTAVDIAGHEATTSVIVRIDRQPPQIALDVADGASFDTDFVNVTGSAMDAASGVADVRCNGVAAVREGSRLQCQVALDPGRNDIIVQAFDLVGHASTAAVTVHRRGTPSTLALSPGLRTLGVEEETTLSLLDEFGAPVTDATWSTSDDTIVSLSAEPIPTLRGLTPGTATIHVDKEGLSTEATVIVVAEFAAGDVWWSMPTSPEYSSEPPIFANRVAADVPDMFAIETREWGRARVRAVRDDGQVLWQQESPGIPLFGDTFGGLVTGVLADVNSGADYRALVRIGGGTIQPWRYDSAGAVGRPAQGYDGTLYAIEYLPGGVDTQGQTIIDKHALVLDGKNGQVVRRTQLPREIDQFLSAQDGITLPTTPPIHCQSTRFESAPETQGPVVGTDGRGYLLVRHYEIDKQAPCLEPFRRRADRAITMGVDLLILSRNNPPQFVPIYASSCTGTLGTTLPCDLPVRGFQIMPDGIGGTLVTWERGTAMVGNSVFVQRSLTRIDGDGAIVERTVGPQFWLELVGQDGRALTFDDQWKSMDVVTGDIAWSDPLPALAPLAARPDNGLAMLDMTTGDLKFTDAKGAIEASQPFGLDWFASPLTNSWVGRRDGQLVAINGTFDDATRWVALQGNRQGQSIVRRVGLGISLKSQEAVNHIPIYHTAIKIAPLNQKWAEAYYDGIRQTPLRDQYGNIFFMLGAGVRNGQDSTINCLPGMEVLVSDTNRDGDVNKIPKAVSVLPVDPLDEFTKIKNLLDYHERYTDNALYACLPEDLTGFYNSNSYVHSLLHYALIPHDEKQPLWPSPGWKTLIPPFFFGQR